MMSDSRHAYQSLGNIRDSALLLVLAHEYICEEHYLVKIGQSIEQAIQQLKKDIIALKNEFPGKFVSDINTDAIIVNIARKAQRMQKPGKEVQQKCVVGELGQGLEKDIQSISEAIGRIERKVEGRDVSYSAKDSMSSLFSGVTSIGAFIGKLISITVKVLVVLLLIAASILGYLFFTMEKISDVEKKLEQGQMALRSNQEALSQLDRKWAQLMGKKQSYTKKDLDLKEKIEFMDLDVEIHKINETMQQVTAQIENNENEIAASQKKIEEMENTPFLKRLLRQSHLP
jgi:hypothetical protein